MHKRTQRGVWVAAMLGLSGTVALAGDDRAMDEKTRTEGVVSEGATYESTDASLGHEERMAAKSIGKNQASIAGLTNMLALHDQQQIELARLAEERALDPGVKAFAGKLLKQHETHLAEVDTMAGERQIQIARIEGAAPTEGVGGSGVSPEMDAAMAQGGEKRAAKSEKRWMEARDEGVRIRGELAALSGAEFDRRFVEEVKKGEERGRKLVRKARNEEPFRHDQALSALLVKTETQLDNTLAQVKQLSL